LKLAGLVGHSTTEPQHFFKRSSVMIQLAVACLVIALIAALLGFGGIAGSFVGVAKLLFVIFLILAVLSFLGGGYRRGRFWG
jgi:uncharacterized membrane protein YtjA (UPF0391 family)